MYKLYYLIFSLPFGLRYYYVGYCASYHVPGVNYFTSSRLCNEWITAGLPHRWFVLNYSSSHKQTTDMECYLITRCWDKHGRLDKGTGTCLNMHAIADFHARWYDATYVERVMSGFRRYISSPDYVNSMSGKHHSRETKEKMRAARLRYFENPQNRELASAAALRRSHSPDYANPNAGKHHSWSPDVKRRMSTSHYGNSLSMEHISRIRAGWTEEKRMHASLVHMKPHSIQHSARSSYAHKLSKAGYPAEVRKIILDYLFPLNS